MRIANVRVFMINEILQIYEHERDLGWMSYVTMTPVALLM